MKAAYIIWLAAAAAAMPAYADSSVYATGKLANGLTYHIVKVPSAGERLVTRLNIGVGAADENQGEEGIAHITEHMVFQSSPQEPKGLSGRLNREGWQMGRHYNAQTTYDYTRYLLTPPKGRSQLDAALTVYRRILEPKQFSAADWTGEKQVILSEWRGQQNLSNRLQRRQHELMYQGARQGRYAPIGSRQAIERADMAAASAFHRRWYAANNAVLVVMGNVSIDETARLIERRFSDLPSQNLPPRRYEEYEPALKNGWHIGEISDRDNAQSRLALVFRFKKQPTQAYEQQAYQRLLDNFAAYIVNLRIKESGQDVDLAMDTLGRNTGSLVLNAEIAPGQHGQMLEVLRTLRQDILRRPATDEELAAYRKALHSNLLPQNAAIPDNLAKVVRMSDETLLQGLPLPDAGVRTIDRSQLYRINAKVVNQRIADWLNAPDKMIQVQAAGETHAKLPPLAKLDTPAAVTASNSLTEPAFDTPQTGAITAEKADDALNIRYLTLNNGDSAVIMKLPMAGNSLYFKAISQAGALSEGQNAWRAYLAAQMAAKSVPEGMSAAAFNQWQTRERIDKYSMRLDGYHQTTDAQALNSALEPLLRLYRRSQMQTDFSALPQYVRQQQAEFDIAQYAKSGRSRALTQEMQYGFNTLMPSEKQGYAALTPALMQQQWQRLTAAPTQYYIVSNLDAETVKPLVARYLASIPRAQTPPVQITRRSGQTVQTAAINDTDGTDIAAYSWQAAAPTPAQFEQIKLLNNLFNAKLKAALRQDGQSAYTVRFQSEVQTGGRRIDSSVTLNTAAAGVPQVWQRAQQVLHEMPDSIGFAEARNLRKLFVEQENLRRRKPELWLERLAASHQSYGDARYLTAIADIPATISRGNLRQTAAMMWSPQNEQTLMLMPKP